MPRPWAELESAPTHRGPRYAQRQAVRFVADHTTPSEHIGIFANLGIASQYDAGVVDVVPYASIEAMPTAGQLHDTLETMRRDSVRHALIDSGITLQEQVAALYAAGYVQTARHGPYVLLTYQRKRSIRH